MGGLVKRMMQPNGEVEPKYMSKFSWQICAGVSALIGIILLIVCVAVGACSCDNICDNAGKNCGSILGGCEKGTYNVGTCKQQVQQHGLVAACNHASCEYGGMSVGAWLFLLILGIA